MIQLGCSKYAACVLALAFAATVSRAQDVWIGGFPDANVNTPTNWVGGVVPPGYMGGGDTLEFTGESNSDMVINVPGVGFNQIELVPGEDDSGFISISGANTLSVGSGGIVLESSEDASSSLYSTAPIQVASNQVWDAGYDGSIIVSGVISGPGEIALAGGGFYKYYEFDNANNTFSGGVTASGARTVVAVGASGNPLGTGPVTLGDGVYLQSQITAPVTIPNALTFGDETSDNQVMIGTENYGGAATNSFVFPGTVTFDTNGEESSSSEVDLFSNTQVVFSGTINGANPGTNLYLGTEETSANTVFIVRGNFGTNIDTVNVSDNASLILDGSGVSQFASVNTIGTDSNTYLGLGAAYSGHVSEFLNSSQIDQSSFSGTLGFDNTTGGTTTFADDIDLTLINGDFVGLGSATPGKSTGASNVILSGSITPPGGLSFTGLEAPEGGTYSFGGGGGTLQVTSSLTDGDWYDGESHHDVSNGLNLNQGNGPLTLILSGPLSYTGNSFVSGGALIFDTPIPAGTYVSTGSDGPDGYIGSTRNSGFLDDDSGSVGTHPQDFINTFDNSSNGVVGFDDLTGGTRAISGAIDMGAYNGLYLGTATKVNFSGTILPNDSGALMFSGVKGGQVTVTSPSLAGTVSLEIGLPYPIESFGSVSSVTLPTDNYFSGNVSLNSGYLYVGTANSIGSGTLIVPGTEGNITTPVGLAPLSNVTLLNDIQVPVQGLHLNSLGSSFTLSLEGAISDYEGEGALIIDGPVTLSGSNSFSGAITVNGTTLSLETNASFSAASGIQANAGSTINFDSASPIIRTLELTGSTASFAASSTPSIENLLIAMGSNVTFGIGSQPLIQSMQSDEINSGNVLTLSAGTSLTFNFDSDPDYHGTFSGPPSANITLDDGELNLWGNSSAYSGGVVVTDYALLVASNNNALGTGTVTVADNGVLATNSGITITNRIVLQPGGTLAGFGTFNSPNPIAIGTSSAVIPGSATLTDYGVPGQIPTVGTLTFGVTNPLTFGAGGHLIFGIQDATGPAGTGYGTIVANGGLTITASSISPFYIGIYSFSPTSNQTGFSAVNFDSTMPFSWTLVSSSTAISGFDPTAFSIDSSNFVNSIGPGQFFVSESGNDLLLNFTPVPEPSTWVLIGMGALGLAAVAMRRSRRPLAS